METALELLAGSLALWARNPGFPELTHLPLIALKRFVKAAPVERFRRQSKLLQDSIEASARVVGAAREAADFAPKDVTQVAEFMQCALPLAVRVHTALTQVQGSHR